MGGGHVEVLHEVVLLGQHAAAALSAPVLGAVEGERRALHVAGVGDRDHHVLVGDQFRDLVGLGNDLGAAGVTVGLAHLLELLADLLQDQPVGSQDGAQPLDQRHQLAVLLDHLLALEPGELLQPHVEDRLRLQLAQGEVLHQPLARLGRGAAGADGGDHLVELVERLEDALEDVGPLLGLAQVEAGAPDHHRLAVVEEVLEQLLRSRTCGWLSTIASRMMPKVVCIGVIL